MLSGANGFPYKFLVPVSFEKDQAKNERQSGLAVSTVPFQGHNTGTGCLHTVLEIGKATLTILNRFQYSIINSKPKFS